MSFGQIIQTAVTSGVSNGAGLISLAFGSAAVGNGHLIVGAVSYDDSATTLIVTDDKSNTYTVVNTNDDTTNTQKLSTFWLPIANNGPRTVTCTISGLPASSAYMALGEYDAAGVAATLNANAINLQLAAGTTLTSGSAAVSKMGCLVWGVTSDQAGLVTTVSAGSGFTIRANQAVQTAYNFATEDLIQATTSAAAATFTLAAGGANWATAMLVIAQGTSARPFPLPLTYATMGV